MQNKKDLVRFFVLFSWSDVCLQYYHWSNLKLFIGLGIQYLIWEISNKNWQNQTLWPNKKDFGKPLTLFIWKLQALMIAMFFFYFCVIHNMWMAKVWKLVELSVLSSTYSYYWLNNESALCCLALVIGEQLMLAW